MRLSLSFLMAALPQSELLVKDSTGFVAVTDAMNWLCKDKELSVAFDSRTCEAGSLFIALKGCNVDGHSFISDVLGAGAAALLVSDKKMLDQIPSPVWQQQLIIVVEDTMKAMIALAVAWRALLTMPIVGITGSVGKTTTKEMMRSILRAAAIESTVSPNNQNTIIGLCSTILAIKTTDKVAVCEVGISLQGEMQERISILKPTIGVITTIGTMHSIGLGGINGIAAEKLKIFSFFESHNVGIIHGDKRMLTDAYYNHPIAKFGLKTKNQVQARKISIDTTSDGQLKLHFTLKWYGKQAKITLVGGHKGYILNALAASTVAYFLQIPFDDVVQGLEDYKGFDGRFQLRKLSVCEGKLISDCYNAGPESMRAAIEAFGKMPVASKKIAVIGDMLELGDKDIFWNRQVGRMIAKAATIDEVILVGPLAAHAQATLPFRTKVALAPTWQEAVPLLKNALIDNAFVLVKGSRSVALKNLVDVFVTS